MTKNIIGLVVVGPRDGSNEKVTELIHSMRSTAKRISQWDKVRAEFGRILKVDPAEIKEQFSMYWPGLQWYCDYQMSRKGRDYWWKQVALDVDSAIHDDKLVVIPDIRTRADADWVVKQGGVIVGCVGNGTGPMDYIGDLERQCIAFTHVLQADAHRVVDETRRVLKAINV